MTPPLLCFSQRNLLFLQLWGDTTINFNFNPDIKNIRFSSIFLISNFITTICLTISEKNLTHIKNIDICAIHKLCHSSESPTVTKLLKNPTMTKLKNLNGDKTEKLKL